MPRDKKEHSLPRPEKDAPKKDQENLPDPPAPTIDPDPPEDATTL